MEQLTTTPFGRRPVTAGLLTQAAVPGVQALHPIADKWSLFRDLTCARKTFSLSDRALLVLNALLSFHPERSLSPDAQLIVFPSNAALSERTHGMAESTLRRHLAALVSCGLIARHDSPNGKRYVRRRRGGEIAHAFGFDLSPLLSRAAEIFDAAEDTRAAEDALRLQRERITLLKRDALKLAAYAQDSGLPGNWDAISDALHLLHSRLRRKLALGDLQAIEAQLVDMLAEISAQVQPETASETTTLSACDSQNERHYQNSDKDTCESEQREETPKAAPTTLPLPVVLSACPDILPYCERPPQSWHELIGTAAFVRGMLGISPDAWEDAQRKMGPEAAAITLLCILQRFSEIRNPGGYLRSLTTKAAAGTFSPTPMVMALLNTSNKRAA
ncbi:plasmid replication protein RepC [Phaeobacter sp. HF9A]|uniref:plasmid replication protein RepC n=1 Tax=Phaeobacter sp. HF9A TaxID=2721561 RepID=UPI001430A8CF|nr:plasmid replication protein RepC [Phaeobacter sp. HF9A]NIZ12033.1 replication initiation protein RepC [Phaeobacter sp. HF9A]